MHSLNPKYAVMHFAGDETVYLIGRVIDVLSPESIATEEDVTRYQEIHKENQAPLSELFLFNDALLSRLHSAYHDSLSAYGTRRIMRNRYSFGKKVRLSVLFYCR